MALSEFKTAFSIIGNPSKSPLYGIKLSEYSSDVELAFECLDTLAKHCDSLISNTAKAYQLISGASHSNGFSLNEIESISNLLELIYSVDKTYHDIINCTDERMLEEMESICDAGRSRDNAYNTILKTYDEAILSINTAVYDAEWRTAMAKGALSKYFAQNKILKKLQTYTILGNKPGKETIIPLLKTISVYQKENAFLTGAASSNNIIARLLKSGKCDWDQVSNSCNKAKLIIRNLSRLTSDAFIVQKMHTNIASLIQKDTPDNDGLLKEITGLVAEIKKDVAFIEDKLKATLVEERSTEWAESIKAKCKQWMSGKDRLRGHIMYNQKKAELNQLGFPEISEQVEEGSVSIDSILDAFHKGFYKAYSEYILGNEPDLIIFHGALFEDKIKRFRALCKDFETLTREELFARLASNLPSLQQEAAQSSEVGILQKNIRNGCRGISLRKFFDTIPNLLYRICPCMLMSPISVAQYIDNEGILYSSVRSN